MLNPIYHFEKMRNVLDEFESSRELSLARTKLDECELWLTKCRPTKEAVERDMAAPVSGSTEEKPNFEWLEYVTEDTLHKVYGAMVDNGVNGDEAREIISTMQNSGILFRERTK